MCRRVAVGLDPALVRIQWIRSTFPARLFSRMVRSRRNFAFNVWMYGRCDSCKLIFSCDYVHWCLRYAVSWHNGLAIHYAIELSDLWETSGSADEQNFLCWVFCLFFRFLSNFYRNVPFLRTATSTLSSQFTHNICPYPCTPSHRHYDILISVANVESLKFIYFCLHCVCTYRFRSFSSFFIGNRFPDWRGKCPAVGYTFPFQNCGQNVDTHGSKIFSKAWTCWHTN